MNTNEIQKALQPVEHEGQLLHDARKLHAWLGVGKRFTSWIKERISDYGFDEGDDFLPVSGKTGSTRGRPRTDYLLTRDMAKELAIVERTAVGRMTRNYFIKMEQAAVTMANQHVANGTPEAIPQDFFDARAEFSKLEARLNP